MVKTLLITLFILVGYVCHAQTLICWKSEVVKYNSYTGEYEAFVKSDMNSEALFNDSYIRINDDKLILTKVRTTSITRTSDGVVKLYDVIKDDGAQLIATVVEDKNGIFKMFLTQGTKAEYGIVYYFKNR